VSVAPAPPAEGGVTAPPPREPAGEACPLCGAPLHPAQEWCLHCGAAARTRLAASPNWKAPISALAVVAVLALGVLAAALVELAGGSSPAAPAITKIVTTTAAVAPTQTTTAPSSALPGTASTGASTLATPKVTAPKIGTSTVGAGKAGTSTPGAGKAGTSTPGAGKVGTGATGTGKAGAGRAGTSAPGTGSLNAKTREEIARGVKEGLHKIHLQLPSTNTR
jgi:hypothetical protein